jgi:hypothetical protein
MSLVFGFVPLFFFLGVFFVGATLGLLYRRPLATGGYSILIVAGVLTAVLTVALAW